MNVELRELAPEQAAQWEIVKFITQTNGDQVFVKSWNFTRKSKNENHKSRKSHRI